MLHDASTDIPARVRSMVWEADGVLSVELVPLSGELPEWTPGAHLDLVLPGVPVRQYSLSGGSTSSYRIAVLREPESRGGSRTIHEKLRPGDAVTIRGPRNHFALEPAAEYLFIAGGIGITPILPMIREAEAAGIPWSLLYLGGARSRMAFLDELATYGDKVRIAPRDETDRVDLDAVLAASPTAAVYACGPERMLTHLQETGGDRVRVEFFSAPVVEYEPGGTFSILLQQSGLELEVPPERSILEVMREGGVDVLSDCEEGICGSCETRVVEGEVEHRDFVLTAQEKQRGDCLMVCVSRAACPLLVLDA